MAETGNRLSQLIVECNEPVYLDSYNWHGSWHWVGRELAVVGRLGTMVVCGRVGSCLVLRGGRVQWGRFGGW